MPRVVDFAKICKDFTTLGGKSFKGTESTVEIKGWLDTCIQIFGDLGIDNATTRMLALRLLQGRAMGWWNSVTLETPEDEITWDHFQVKFETKFISTVQKSILLKRFVELKQNGRPVLEYFLTLKPCPSMLVHILRLLTKRMRSLSWAWTNILGISW